MDFMFTIHTMERSCGACSVYFLTVKNTTATEVTDKICFTERAKKTRDQSDLAEESI